MIRGYFVSENRHRYCLGSGRTGCPPEAAARRETEEERAAERLERPARPGHLAVEGHAAEAAGEMPTTSFMPDAD